LVTLSITQCIPRTPLTHASVYNNSQYEAHSFEDRLASRSAGN